MTKKVATGRKVKSWQETTPLGQIATVTAKLGISKKEQWFGSNLSPVWMPRRSNFRQFSLHFKEHLLSVELQWILLWIVLILNGDEWVFDSRNVLMLTEKLQNRIITSLSPFSKIPTKTKNFRQRPEAFIHTDMRRFKMQTSDMGPLPPSWQDLLVTLCLCIYLIKPFHMVILTWTDTFVKVNVAYIFLFLNP